MKSGFISLIGRPNVGKSTLLNTILGKKIVITSNKAQTTRNIIQGIYNDDESQMVFVDTPGIHKPNHKLGKILNEQAYFSIQDVDLNLFLVDAKEGLGTGDKYILNKIKEVNKPTILVINKIDKINKEQLLNRINEYKDIYNFDEIVPISASKNDNVDTLLKVLKNYLPDKIQYFNTDQITNKTTEFLIAELIREKIFHFTSDEIPHSITCYTESIKKNNKGYLINIVIVVDRNSIKKIIVGKNGTMIKKIGIEARKDIEQLLSKKIYLELFVKVIKKWRDKEQYLQEYGFNDYLK